MLSGQPKLRKSSTSFSVEHAFVSGAYPERVDIMERELG